MTERPILFSGPMVNALLDGSKTQTRRIIKPQPVWKDQEPYAKDGFFDSVGHYHRCKFGQVGDRLWVKETHRHNGNTWCNQGPDYVQANVEYQADGARLKMGRWAEFTDAPKKDWWNTGKAPWAPSIFMPRWASRISLEITEVRVQRLQDISEEDALAEGVKVRPGTRWWQGYTDSLGLDHLVHQTVPGDEPPDWLIEPKPAGYDPADRAADKYRWLWESINGNGSWAANPWVWAITFQRVPTPTEVPNE